MSGMSFTIKSAIGNLRRIRQIILNKFDNYEIYFRKYAAPYSNNLQNGELVMYGVPKERVKR